MLAAPMLPLLRLKTSLSCARVRNPILPLCCSWENSQSAPATHTRQVVKGPAGWPKITATALKRTSHAFPFIHLHDSCITSLSLSPPYPYPTLAVLLDNSVQELGFSIDTYRQPTGFKLQAPVLL